MKERYAVTLPAAGQNEWSVDLHASPCGIEEVAGTGLLEPGHLMPLDGDGEHASTFELAVDPQFVEILLEAFQVGSAEPLEHGVLLGPPGPAVLLAMGQVGLSQNPPLRPMLPSRSARPTRA